MKRFIHIVMFSFSLFSTSGAHADDWTNEWFSSVTVSGPSAFEGQKRGYLSGGQISARYDMSTDNLFSATLPSAKTSCGGVDLFAGGISFLDPEYLVSKLENILQAAPAMAFNMALKAHCQQCEDIMSKLESMSTYLNSIQVNDCRMAKQLADEIFTIEQQIFGDKLMVAAADRDAADGTAKNYQATQDNIDAAAGNIVTDHHADTASCPAPIRELFADGSVVENAARRVGMLPAADLIRAYIGDIVIDWPAGQPVPRYDFVTPCESQERYSAADFIEGDVLERPVSGACRPNTTVSIIDNVRTDMNSIAAKIEAGGAFTAAEVSFINQSAQPVYAILETAVSRGTVADTIAAYEYPIASALAYRVFDDLLRNAEFLVNKAISDSRTLGRDPAAASPDNCNLAVYGIIFKDLDLMRDRLLDTRRVSIQAYAESVENTAALIESVTFIERGMDRTLDQFGDKVAKE